MRFSTAKNARRHDVEGPRLLQGVEHFGSELGCVFVRVCVF
jgi:hypothetical protein